MRLGVAALLGWLAAWPVGAQSLPEVTIEPEIRALLAVKQRMRDSLEEVPELVCSQTVRRISAKRSPEMTACVASTRSVA